MLVQLVDAFFEFEKFITCFVEVWVVLDFLLSPKEWDDIWLLLGLVFFLILWIRFIGFMFEIFVLINVFLFSCLGLVNLRFSFFLSGSFGNVHATT